MKLRFAIAGLCVFALAALPLRAQHGGGGHAGGASHGGGGWHAGSAGSGGGHYSGGASQSRGNAGGSYGAAMYPPSARGHASAGTAESARPASSYYTSHDSAAQSGWQALYSGGSNIHFSASMLPPNARGYSAAPHQSIAPVSPAQAGIATRRLQSQWIARADFDGRGRYHHRLRGGFGRGFGEPFCGPFLGFGYCGGSFFYGYYGDAFGCLGGGYWDDSNWAGASAVLNLSPCLGLAYEPDEEQVSPGEPDESASPDAAPADAIPENDAASPEDNSAEQPGAPPAAADHSSETLLQLKDGSMYGLVQYWVAGGVLNYITDYGARNAIPLDRIDLAKTVQLNSQRGVPFILQTSSTSR